MASTFSDVHFEAVHIPETWDPDPNDKSVETVELPGLVNIYLVVDGGRILHDQYNAARIFEAIDAGQKNQDQSSAQAQTGQSEQDATLSSGDAPNPYTPPQG